MPSTFCHFLSIFFLCLRHNNLFYNNQHSQKLNKGQAKSCNFFLQNWSRLQQSYPMVMSSCGLSVSFDKLHLPTSTETVIVGVADCIFQRWLQQYLLLHLLFCSMTFLYPHQDLTTLFPLNLGKLVIALLNRDETGLRGY